MMEFDSEKFERKLLNLKDTQDSITGLSKWCLSKHAAHKPIVKSWLKILKEVKIEQRLSLFYLANDVIQHSKRKNYEFVESWATTLQRATTLVRDDKVKEKISRIFKIWEQRGIYSEDFITDLHGLLLINSKQPASQNSAINLLSNSQSQSSTGSSPITARSDDDEEEFQLPNVVSNIRKCVALEAETDTSLKLVVKANIPDVDKIRSNLKDRTFVKETEKDVQSAEKYYDDFINAINAEIRARKLLLTALEQADKFYRNQRRDVKKVVYAYKNFGDRIKLIQNELNQKATSLQSPIPSPDINAPSPGPDDNDFNLPSEMNFYNPNGAYGSFLNDAHLPFDVNEFYRESPPLPSNSHIPVLQSQESQAPLNDFYNSLIPSKLEAYNPAMGYGDPYKLPPLPATEPSVNVKTQHYVSTIPPPPPSQPAPPVEFFPPLPSVSNSLNTSTDDYLWSANDWMNETPISPPSYERKSHGETVEYIEESLRDIDSSLNDIDHRQLFGADLESKEIDHRNLISLTGSPGMGNGTNNIANGSDKNFLQPPPEMPMSSHQFNNFTGQPYPRNTRPALLPTPSVPPQRYNRHLSMMSDSSKSFEEIETAEDMDMSDDDGTGMESSHSEVPDHRDFYQMPPQRFPQVNLNRPPPLLSHDNIEMGQQRKSWIHNNMDMEEQQDQQQSQNFMSPPPPNHGGFPKNNFRGQARGRGMNNGGFRGNNRRGSRGNFRGNNRGGQW